jgi:hypothetical protein
VVDTDQRVKAAAAADLVRLVSVNMWPPVIGPFNFNRLNLKNPKKI